MLFEFVEANRALIIERTRAKVALRVAPRPTEIELTTGVPLFLDQLARNLRLVAPPANEAPVRGAAAHGAALLHRGYTVAQVVHDYGDICQAVTELAEELDAPITTDEFHTLNLCLDNAIAEAVTEYLRLREQSLVDGETERSGVFPHELRNRLSGAQLAFMAIRSGRAPISGSVAAVLSRNLHGMGALISRALVEVRLDSGNAQMQRLQLFELLEQAEVDGSMEAGVHGVSLTVGAVPLDVEVNADPQILSGAIANLMQNAFKFTQAGGAVSVTTTVSAGRVAIAIEDQCGGLPAGKAEELFSAFEQRGTNRKGLGLGLFISRKGIEACGGTLRVQDLPGIGCIFTIDLPVLPRA